MPCLFRFAIFAVLAVTLSGCSGIGRSEVDSWTEETLLNSGEFITVNRTVRYAMKSAPFNPLKSALRETSRTSSFEWRGRQYTFDQDAMVIAVSPSNELTILRPFNRADTPTNTHCRRPSYKQFRFVGDQWQVQTAVDLWTYGLARNQLFSFGDPDVVLTHVTTVMKTKLDGGNSYLLDTPGFRRIMENHVSIGCQNSL